MGDLRPGDLPVLRMLPETSSVLHCRARSGVFVYGDIEGRMLLKPIAPYTVFFGCDDSTATDLRDFDVIGLIIQWSQVVRYADYKT